MKYENSVGQGNQSAIFSALFSILAAFFLIFMPYINLRIEKYNLLDLLEMKHSSDALVISIAIIIGVVCSVIAIICSIFRNIPCKIIHILFDFIGLIANAFVWMSLPMEIVSGAPIIYTILTILSMVLILFAKRRGREKNSDFMTYVDSKNVWEVTGMKKVFRLLTTLIIPISLIVVMPLMRVGANDVGYPVKGYVCTYYENSYGNWIKYAYDSDGNLTYKEQSDGYWVKFTYDSNGNPTYEEQSDGDWTKYTYDSNGQLTYSEQSNGYCVKYTYDSNGNLTDETSNESYWVKYTYGSNGKLQKKKYSFGSYEKYTYNSNGDLTRLTTNNGSETYKYDSNGNLISKSIYDGLGVFSNVYTYRYDSDGRLISADTSIGSTKYTYDSNGNRIHEETDYSSWENYTYAKIGSEESMVNKYEQTTETTTTEIIDSNTNKADSVTSDKNANPSATPYVIGITVSIIIIVLIIAGVKKSKKTTRGDKKWKEWLFYCFQ